ncbi:xylose isomerase [Palleronia aestuarii]|uniref:Xylose isomerase n=2 Tax=Palleronia aestuarii TaxID=568105 RepID=A0A2W7MRV5_9RHOB|nr:xylose isomerase [Palleronia aestuarii]
MGRRMKDQLRFSACYWHSFNWPRCDPFWTPTLVRRWMSGAIEKADVAFEMFRLLDVPFFAFRDVDLAPEGDDLDASVANLGAVVDFFEEKMAALGICPLWGTAYPFSHPCYMAGAANNPDPRPRPLLLCLRTGKGRA